MVRASEVTRITLWTRRLAGAALSLLSIAMLQGLAAPWGQLGGLVSERERWCASFALFAGPVVGFTLARSVRGLAMADRPRRLRRPIVLLFYPVAAATALALSALSLAGCTAAIGIVAGGFASYALGLAFELVGLPLLAGRSPLASDPCERGE